MTAIIEIVSSVNSFLDYIITDIDQANDLKPNIQHKSMFLLKLSLMFDQLAHLTIS